MQKRVESYTRRARAQKERIDQESLGRRSARAIDATIRRLLYALIKRVLKVEPTQQKLPLSELTSLLIIPYGDAIGDLLVALPVSRAIKRRNPECKIGIFVSERNRSLLRCEDSIDEEFVFGGRQDWRHFGELTRARRQDFQVLLNLHFTKLSDYGLIANYVGPRAIKGTLRMKRSHHYQLLFNRLSPLYRYKVHISQLSLAILDDVIELSSAPLLLKESELSQSICSHVFDGMQARVSKALEEAGASWFIYINPQARNPEREWGYLNITKLAAELLRLYPEAAVVLTSSPTLQAETQELVRKFGHSRMLFVQSGDDLNEIAALCRLTRMIITPDTAVVHFASAEKKPVVVLMPDTREIHLEWLPLHCPSVLLTPAAGEFVRSIRVEDVMSAVQDLLTGTIQHSATIFGDQRALEMPYQVSAGDVPLSSILQDLTIR